MVIAFDDMGSDGGMILREFLSVYCVYFQVFDVFSFHLLVMMHL